MAYKTKRPTIKVNSINNFEFWVGMFGQRTKKWQEQTLKEKNKGKNPFETEEDRQDKIKALKFILGK